MRHESRLSPGYSRRAASGSSTTSAVQEVRDALGLDRIHLLGQSFGGMLAIEYMQRRPAGIESLVLANTTASMPMQREVLRACARHCRRRLGRRWMKANVRAISTPEYGQALFTFYQRHVCRLEQWPPALLAMGASMMGNPVYVEMWGANELTPAGNLVTWDRSAELARISVPTLVTCGRYGEIVPDCAQAISDGVANSSLVVFEQSAHVPHLEQPEAFRSAVSEFLAAGD